MQLTSRQAKELEYHRGHAAEHRESLTHVSFDILDLSKTRWWNAYWQMYRSLRTVEFCGRRVLVVGCGAGHDAIRLSRLGADVYAFDLSPELISLASKTAEEHRQPIHFRQMAAERVDYPDSFFDYIVVVDILHHCEVDRVLAELSRVSANDAIWIVNEIYTHSRLQRIRDARFVHKWLYPSISRIIYEGKPYITDDERKLDERHVERLSNFISVDALAYYYFLVKRVLPDWAVLARIDRALLVAARPFAPVLAGRFVMRGTVKKESAQSGRSL